MDEELEAALMRAGHQIEQLQRQCEVLRLELENVRADGLLLAKSAVAAERERCAKVCEQADDDGEGPDCWGWHAKDYAKAIRADPQPLQVKGE